MWWRVLAAAVAGLALWLSFPAFNLWFLAPVGVTLFAVCTCGVRWWQGTGLGFITGVGFFLPLLPWIGEYLGPLPVVALVTLEALYVALAGWAMSRIPLPSSARTRARTQDARAGFEWGLVIWAVAVACAWTGAEWLRAVTPFGGFAWGRLAFGQADAFYAPAVAYVGTTGLTLFVALCGTAMAAVMLRLRSAAGEWTRLVPALATVLVLCGLGALVPVPNLPTIGSAHVVAIQGNVPTAGLAFNAQRRAVTDNHAQVTRAAAAQVRAGTLAAPDLVMWPENSSDLDPTRHTDAAAVIQGAVDAIDAPTLVGAVLREPADMASNATLLYLPGVGIVDRYVKQRPVPFAEYMPYRTFFRAITPMVDLLTRDFAPGEQDVVFTIERPGQVPIRVATPICFEVAVDDVMAAPVRAGANLLAVPTNNATFGYTDESVQQVGISRIRAMEFGRSVVHVSTVGVSAMITPDGRIHSQTSLFTAALLNAELPLHEQKTPATWLGPWPALSAILAWALIAVRALRRRG